MAVLLMMLLDCATCSVPVVAVNDTPAAVPELTNCGEPLFAAPDKASPLAPTTLIAPPVAVTVPNAASDGTFNVKVPELDSSACEPADDPTCQPWAELMMAFVPVVLNFKVPSTSAVFVPVWVTVNVKPACPCPLASSTTYPDGMLTSGTPLPGRLKGNRITLPPVAVIGPNAGS